MTSSTTFNSQELAELQPVENEMYTREGFGRKNFRYQFANAEDIGINDRYVEEEETTYVNPDTTEMPHGPTGIGEVAGGGVDFVRQEGDVHATYRFTQGFTVAEEDARAGAVSLDEQRRQISEMYDFFADGMWFNGIADQSGNQVKPGMFQWLKSAIPAERTFDCENYDGDSGDTADLVSNDTQENIIKYHAYQTQSGELLDDGDSWGMILGRQEALANLQKVRPADGGITPRDTYWDAINAENGVGVGIQDYMLIPEQLRFTEAPNGEQPLTIDLTQNLGSDELIILPSMDAVRENYWRLMQMSEPWSLPPTRERGGKVTYDNVWRYSQYYDPMNAYANAQDSIHLTNVSTLFV